MRDGRWCGPVCTEPYEHCIGEMHCDHGACKVPDCLCSCHDMGKKMPVIAYDASMPLMLPFIPKDGVQYRLKISKKDLWPCCAGFIVKHLRARRTAQMAEPPDGHEMRCTECGGGITLRDGEWL